jgi:hypothetical protein
MSQGTYLVAIPQELSVATSRQRASSSYMHSLSADAMIGNEVLAQHALLAIEVPGAD